MNIGSTVMIDLNGYVHTTSGKTLFEAARNALDFFPHVLRTETSPKRHHENFLGWRQKRMAGESRTDHADVPMLHGRSYHACETNRKSSALANMHELIRSHNELRGGLIIAGKEIRKLNFGKLDSPVLVRLRTALRDARVVARKYKKA